MPTSDGRIKGMNTIGINNAWLDEVTRRIEQERQDKRDGKSPKNGKTSETKE